MKLKLLVILIALLQPILVLTFLGDVHSLSKTWGTFLQPIFIFTNATTSFYFYQVDRWKFSGLLLMLLTAFSIDIFPQTHNLLALVFFVSCIYGITRGSYYYVFIGLYLIAVPIFYLYGLFYCEFWAVSVLCTYHLRLLFIANRIKVEDLV